MNLVPTNAVFNPKTDKDTTCFMHIDLSITYTDHHIHFTFQTHPVNTYLLTTRAFSSAPVRLAASRLFTTQVSKSMTWINKLSDTTGCNRKVIPTAGASAATCWGAKSSTTGMFAHVNRNRRRCTNLFSENHRFDVSGNILEHYCDGDIVNELTALARAPKAPDSLYI